VNSTVADKSGLRFPPSSAEVGLIVREILDLPAQVIEERFALRPGEGALSLFAGLVSGPTGNQAVYYTEIYTNRDSLSMTSEVRLDALALCGVPVYEVLEARKRHPYIARLIQGAALREYQAHLIPWGGVSDFGCLYGDGVLLAGDAGKFTTATGVGSWTAMASGVAAARTVKYACERGDFSKATLAVYEGFLDQEGLIATQQEARREWKQETDVFDLAVQYSDPLLRIAGRYLDRWEPEPIGQPYSLWGEAYYNLVKPLAPWYLGWLLGLVTWFDTRRWRRRQAARHGRGVNG
jgi:flavin-dependent dehydrogenase